MHLSTIYSGFYRLPINKRLLIMEVESQLLLSKINESYQLNPLSTIYAISIQLRFLYCVIFRVFVGIKWGIFSWGKVFTIPLPNSNMYKGEILVLNIGTE